MRTIPQTLFFRLKQNVSLQTLSEEIVPEKWKLALHSSLKERSEFYETFEWQAFSKNMVIAKREGFLVLIDLDTGHEIASALFPGKKSSFFFDEFKSCKLSNTLAKCSDIRAFTRLCTIIRHATSYRMLDENDKTIAWLTTDALSLDDKKSPEPFIHLLSLTPLKGYETNVAPVEQLLLSHTCVTNMIEFRALFLLIMQAAERKVQDYSPKICLTLDPDAPINESARQLLQCTFTIMRQNEEGIKKNTDSEFLHDYRVAVRRTRSIMKQLKGVFDQNKTAYFLNRFRELGKRTNELRDHDAYLLRQKTYCLYLPPLFQPALKILFSTIATSRKPLHKQFSRYLSSDNYRVFLEEWAQFLVQKSLTEENPPPDAILTTKSVAKKQIKKAWKKVIRHGRLIGKEATDTELHALRIDCKKLRYLLEFFISIFPVETITPVIRHLKVLQENLGNFVDISVQLRSLHEQLDVMDREKLSAAAIGGLMTTLFQKQEESRLAFHKSFRSFDHEETNQLFHDLLTGTTLQ